MLEHAGLAARFGAAPITALDSYVNGCAIDLTVLVDLWATNASGTPPSAGQRAAPWSADGAEAAFELGLDGLILALERQLGDPPAG